MLVAGSANLDFVVQAPRIPAPGETIMGRSFQTFPGGKGANQAVACARAGGVATQFVGAVGSDSLAEPILESLRNAGVQVQAVPSTEAPTGTAFICVDAHGENAITVVSGANALLGPQHLPPLDGIHFLLLQLETPVATLHAYAKTARALGIQVVLNAAPASPDCLALLTDIDVLVVNEGELALVSGISGTVRAQMESLPVPTVIATLGARGCVARTPDGYCVQTAVPVQVKDTTAAGDTFCGALVAALSEGQSMQVALQAASAAAALACTRDGAQASIPAREEVMALMATAPQACEAGTLALAEYCGIPHAQSHI
ncbi:MAG: ribokinase [Rhodoferax sp.]|nr:MAG: ribokinase [Rhodoferax sp.]